MGRQFSPEESDTRLADPFTLTICAMSPRNERSQRPERRAFIKRTAFDASSVMIFHARSTERRWTPCYLHRYRRYVKVNSGDRDKRHVLQPLS
jgi:hypothetical protein